MCAIVSERGSIVLAVVNVVGFPQQRPTTTAARGASRLARTSTGSLKHLQTLYVKWNKETRDPSVEEDRCAGDVIRTVLDDVKLKETFKEDEEELVDILLAEARGPEKFTDIEWGIKDGETENKDTKSPPGSGVCARLKRSAFDRLQLFLERVSFCEVMRAWQGHPRRAETQCVRCRKQIHR